MWFRTFQLSVTCGRRRGQAHRCMGSDGAMLLGQSNMGLTGFDISICGRACDPSCSDSLNGAKNRIANEQFAYAA